MPAALAGQAVAVGALAYNRVAQRGYRRDVLYCYDLELPEDFVPRNTDGEVEEFRLLPIEEVARLVRETDDFKLNCNLVIIDFLIRHGLLPPDHDDYLSLVSGLRCPEYFASNSLTTLPLAASFLPIRFSDSLTGFFSSGMKSRSSRQ